MTVDRTLKGVPAAISRTGDVVVKMCSVHGHVMVSEYQCKCTEKVKRNICPRCQDDYGRVQGSEVIKCPYCKVDCIHATGDCGNRLRG
jgi:hypothetical protein